MSVIIRLQNLPWTANARDIRNFFTGLSIPEGGVHIIGGEMGDAFIAFSTDEDARCAMLKDREKLMEAQVRLLLSSRAEMQKVIETARKQAAEPSIEDEPAPMPVPAPAPVSKPNPAVGMPPVPQPPIIGGLHSFLSQQQQQQAVAKQTAPPSFLAYQQQAGITLADVDQGAASASKSSKSHGLLRPRLSRSRSRSSSSDDSSLERGRDRERERDQRGNRKRRNERADSDERQLKLEPGSLSAMSNLLPWALGAGAPSAPSASSLPGLQPSLGHGHVQSMGLMANLPPMVPALQSYTTSSSISSGHNNNHNNNYNLNVPAISGNAMLAANTKSVDMAGQIPGLGLSLALPTGASMFSTQQQLSNMPAPVPAPTLSAAAQEPPQPIAFASVNPYAQMYPQLFQQQQLLLQQQASPKSSPGGVGVGPGGATAETCYIKISGMCPSTTYSDLRKYFAGLYIPHNGIKIINGLNGNRTGCAYIEFSRVSSAQKALSRHNTLFRDRLVHILPIGDEEFERAEDRYRPPPSGGHGGGTGGGGGGGSDFAAPSSNVLYVENLPQLTTEQDIMKMFSATCTIVDILLSPSPHNRREFVAYVLFARENEARSALEDSGRHCIGFRKLRVRASSEAEMKSAKDKQRRANEQLLKEEQLQREEAERERLAQEQQLLLAKEAAMAAANLANLAASNGLANNNNGLGLSPNQAKFNSDPRRRGGEELPPQSQQLTQQQQQQLKAQVQLPMLNMQPFANPGQQMGSIGNNGGNLPFGLNNAPNNNNINNNNNNNDIDPFGMHMNNHNNFNNFNNNNGPFAMNNHNNNGNGNQGPPNGRRSDEDNFVRVHNCEYGTRVNDLGELFTTENLRIVHIEMLYNDRNMPAGEFIVEFSDVHNAKAAIREFHNRRFRGRGLRVVHVTPQEIADRMGKPFMDYVPGGNGPRQDDAPLMTAQSRRRGPSRFDDVGNRPQLPPQQSDMDVMEEEKQQQRFNPFADRAGGIGPGPELGDVAPVVVAPPIIAPPLAMPESDLPVINVNNVPDDGIPDKFNRPGCVVAMRNVPFKADLKDILRFFNDYKLSPDDIIRRFNDDGKPTGDARVAFESAAEARSAFDSRRRRQIFNRNVYLDII